MLVGLVQWQAPSRSRSNQNRGPRPQGGPSGRGRGRAPGSASKSRRSDPEALVEVVLEVIDQEEVAVGAESESPQHSFCLNPSVTYGEQGGYALGRCSRA